MPDTITQTTNRYIMNTYKRFPLELDSGRGIRLTDTRGRVYLDFLSGIAVNALGYGHPALTRTITEGAAGLIHTSNLFHTRNQGQLARFLTQQAGLDKAFFCNSGAEANEGAIKLARRWGQGRYRIIAAHQSFHGRTLATVAATGQTRYQEGYAPLPSGFDHVSFNDIPALCRAICEDTVAVLLEPVQAEGGVIIPDPGYLPAVRRICHENNLLLILDEVQTGMGRTGKWFAHQHSGIRPDIMTLAKALGGGLPVGCVLATDQVAAVWNPGDHASTFGGGEFACGVALAVCRELAEQQWPDHASRVGRHCLEGLHELAIRFPDIIAGARGLGLLIGLQLCPGQDTAIWTHAFIEQGLITAGAGRDVIRLAPPLITSMSDVDEALAIMQRTFAMRPFTPDAYSPGPTERTS